MQKIKIRLPATITNLGPGIGSLGLALGLYVTVEMSRRDDTTLNLELRGEGAEAFSSDLKHPVVLGIGRFFQILERAQLGLNIRVENQIPLMSGLGGEAALMIAGVLGVNDIMGYPHTRREVIAAAARFTRPDHAVTSIAGGLAAAALDGGDVLDCALPVQSTQIVVVVPDIDSYRRPPYPEQIPTTSALYNLTRLPLLLAALRDGDLDLLARVLDDRVHLPRISASIEGYSHVVEVAQRAGAKAVTVSGNGPALIAFAQDNHKRIAEDMRLAFGSVGVDARTWVLPIDTQGVVISAMQSA